MTQAIKTEKAELERKLRARSDNLCFRQNIAAIEARIAAIDEELAANG